MIIKKILSCAYIICDFNQIIIPFKFLNLKGTGGKYNECYNKIKYAPLSGAYFFNIKSILQTHTKNIIFSM